MDDIEIGFMSFNVGDDNQLFYFGFEAGLEDKLEERLTIIAKDILSELGLIECIDTEPLLMMTLILITALAVFSFHGLFLERKQLFSLFH